MIDRRGSLTGAGRGWRAFSLPGRRRPGPRPPGKGIYES